ncbi:unnamed protein product [Onchocerca ochengi]|uniref:Uncharacterized protein n=1 Tax=Onchocerca ochengi TaxID=42157 RepID=A0A182EBG8_ONCOC|nr:unnamed protein product [Onchocerca ochengi]
MSRKIISPAEKEETAQMHAAAAAAASMMTASTKGHHHDGDNDVDENNLVIMIGSRWESEIEDDCDSDGDIHSSWQRKAMNDW